ncbi:MAG: threonylcarbamoyl-AMP synthase [Bacteroidales bacterium]|nr:threonylcarbamoyl-AMP synthase [Bacteroidales bacterium]
MLIRIYPDNPNVREVRRVADTLRQGGIAVLPTDTLYAFVCSMEFKQSVEAIARLKGFKLKQAKFSMLCSSLSQASEYLRPLDGDTFRLLRSCLPGPYTFILQANNNLNRNYQNANKTIGVRVPDNGVLHAVVEELGAPLIGTSVRLENEDQEVEYLTDPELINEQFGRQVDLVVDGGIGTAEPSTVVDLSEGYPLLVRQGKGEFEI